MLFCFDMYMRDKKGRTFFSEGPPFLNTLIYYLLLRNGLIPVFYFILSLKLWGISGMAPCRVHT